MTKVDFIKEKKQEGKEQKRRRFCFLTLDDTDLVDELCIRHFHEVAGTRVEVKKAEPKGSRQRYYGGYYDYGYGPYNDYHGYYNGPEYYNGGYGYGYGPGQCNSSQVFCTLPSEINLLINDKLLMTDQSINSFNVLMLRI